MVPPQANSNEFWFNFNFLERREFEPTRFLGNGETKNEETKLDEFQNLELGDGLEHHEQIQ